MKLLVFDTETTGLPDKSASIYESSKWPHIVQLSYIFYDTSLNTSVIKDEYIKLSPVVNISEESIKIHKLDREFLNKNGKHIVPVLREFNKYLKACDIVIGHNISFDKRMIFVECFRNKVEQEFTKFKDNHKINKKEFCTMKNSTKFCNITSLNKANKEYVKLPKLEELHEKLFPNENKPENLHNSLIDVFITLKCYMKLEHNYIISNLI